MMNNSLKSRLHEYFNNPNYLYLLVALVALIINGAISLKFEHSHYLMDFCYALVIFLGPFYSSSSYSSFLRHFLLGIVIFVLYSLQVHGSAAGGSISSFITLIFFYLLFHKLLKYVWIEDDVTINVLLASICGYLVLGITAGVIFTFIDSSIPGSFSIQKSTNYFDFMYFSFITLTSIGYGDIVPIDPVARMTAILLSIAGQLYITIILALIVGKYMSKTKS